MHAWEVNILHKYTLFFYIVHLVNFNSLSLRLNRGTALGHCARHFILCLVLNQPKKTGNCSDMTEKLLTGM